jgi:hypothetical protein
MSVAMAERAKTSLQRKIGGPLSSLNRVELIASGTQALSLLDSQIDAELFAYRDKLKRALAVRPVGADALYAVAHEVRGIAGTFGFANLGLIADALARYVVGCNERRSLPADEVLVALGGAMALGFMTDAQGGAELANLTKAAQALTAKLFRH